MGHQQRRTTPESAGPQRWPDSYDEEKAPKHTAVCTGCGLVAMAGRWQRGEPPAGAEKTTCPACLRVRERDPAGTLRIRGASAEQMAEMVALARSLAEIQEAEHPLERLMGVDEKGGGVVLETTGVHLARLIAGRLESAFHGRVTRRFEEEGRLRVEWAPE